MIHEHLEKYLPLNGYRFKLNKTNWMVVAMKSSPTKYQPEEIVRLWVEDKDCCFYCLIDIERSQGAWETFIPVLDKMLEENK